MKSYSRAKGRKWETVAMEYLEKVGFKPIEKNFNLNHGEIDLIMQQEDCIVFVEVKAASQRSGYSVYDRLSKRKLWKLRRSIDFWLAKHNKNNAIWRLDYVGISFEGDNYEIFHEQFIQLDTQYTKRSN